MNIRMQDGTARCENHLDSSNTEGYTNEACIYCPVAEAKTVEISPRENETNTYSKPSRNMPVRRILSHNRTINGISYRFTRFLSQDGSNSLVVLRESDGKTVHRFHEDTETRRNRRNEWVKNNRESYQALRELTKF